MGGFEGEVWAGIALFGGDFLLEIFLCGSSGTCEKGLGGEVIFGGWEDLRSKFGKVFPCLEAFFVLVLIIKGFFGLGVSRIGSAGVSGARRVRR